MYLKLLIISLAAILLAACSGTKNSPQENRKDAACPPDMMCTMIFKSITLTIKDKNGVPVMLDNYYAYLPKNGDTVIAMKATENYGASEGRYPVADDGAMNKVGMTGSEVIFKGFKNGTEVVQHSMVIGHDCCHFAKISGSDDIILN